MKRIAICGLSLLLASKIALSQNIEVVNERKLELGLAGKILVENHLTANPNKPGHLLLSGMYADSSKNDLYGNFCATSDNGGETWNNVKLFEIPEGADPWGVITKTGSALTAVLGLEELFVYRSENGGKEWDNTPINLGKGHDHETMIQDTARGIIYLVSIQGRKIYVNHSTDDGKSFGKPTSCAFSNLNTNTMTPVLLEDGTLMISFAAFSRPAISGTRDGGRSERLKKSLSWLIPFSIDKGFGIPLFISESCETGFPVLANDLSISKFRGNMYYVCSSQTDQSVIFHYSNTLGKSWTAGQVLFAYTNHAQSDRNPFVGIPQVVVNSKGTIGIIWQSRMDDANGKCQYLFFSASTDGGKTFAKPIRVSSELSCMERSENKWAGTRYKSGGDYTGFITDENGDFLAIWPDSRNGISELFMARIRVKE